MDESDFELAYIDGRCTNAIEANRLYQLLGDGASPQSWVAEHVVSSLNMTRDLDWTINDGRVLVSVLAVLRMAGSAEWDGVGWEHVSRAIQARIAPLLTPDFAGFDYWKAYRSLDRSARSACNREAYSQVRQKWAIEVMSLKFVWLMSNNRPLPN